MIVGEVGVTSTDVDLAIDQHRSSTLTAVDDSLPSALRSHAPSPALNSSRSGDRHPTLYSRPNDEVIPAVSDFNDLSKPSSERHHTVFTRPPTRGQAEVTVDGIPHQIDDPLSQKDGELSRPDGVHDHADTNVSSLHITHGMLNPSNAHSPIRIQPSAQVPLRNEPSTSEDGSGAELDSNEPLPAYTSPAQSRSLLDQGQAEHVTAVQDAPGRLTLEDEDDDDDHVFSVCAIIFLKSTEITTR